MEQVYFLESIVMNEENVNNHIVLFNASALLENGNINSHELFTDEIIYNRYMQVDFLSGFVKFKNSRLISANNTYVARHYIFQNNAIRHLVMRNSVDARKEVHTLEEVFSYHVNVGHGNCTFIISRNTIIAVDCSNFDYLNKKNYQNNIDSCINYILTKFRLKSFHIDYFILTHPHYDHYSGINKLIDEGYIDNTTIFYMNIYYSMPSPTFNTTLQNIYRCGCPIIEPITGNSNNIIDIIYPDRRLVKTSRTVHNALNPIIDKNPNNSSVVVRIIGKDKSFTFTGDIETTAWNRVVGCYPYFKIPITLQFPTMEVLMDT